MTNINAIAQVYTSIQQQILSILNTDTGLPYFNTVAVFNDQIKRSKSGKGYNYWDPSVFIQIKSSNEGSYGDQLTFAEFDVTFHISMYQLNGWDLASLDENLYIFHLRNLIKSNFSLFQPPQCGPFNWKGEEQQFDHDQIYTYRLSYKCYYVDKVSDPFITGYEYLSATGSTTLTLTASFTASIS